MQNLLKFITFNLFSSLVVVHIPRINILTVIPIMDLVILDTRRKIIQNNSLTPQCLNRQTKIDIGKQIVNNNTCLCSEKNDHFEITIKDENKPQAKM